MKSFIKTNSTYKMTAKSETIPKKESIAIISSVLFNLIRDDWDSMLLFWFFCPYHHHHHWTQKPKLHSDVQMCEERKKNILSNTHLELSYRKQKFKWVQLFFFCFSGWLLKIMEKFCTHSTFNEIVKRIKWQMEWDEERIWPFWKYPSDIRILMH